MKKAPRRKEAKEKSEGSSESSAVSTKQENRQLRGKKGRAENSNRQSRLLITVLGPALSESLHLTALCQGVLRRRTHNQAFH